MELEADIQAFWRDFLARTGRDERTPLYAVFHFADDATDANALAELVLNRRKAATASLLWEYEASGRRPPCAGDLSLVTDGQGAARCVIETLAVEVRAFEDVDAGFAAAEGEGDSSLAYWRDAHWAYFGRLCQRLGRERSPRMPVVCERFRVLFVAAGV